MASRGAVVTQCRICGRPLREARNRTFVRGGSIWPKAVRQLSGSKWGNWPSTSIGVAIDMTEAGLAKKLTSQWRREVPPVRSRR